MLEALVGLVAALQAGTLVVIWKKMPAPRKRQKPPVPFGL